MSSQHDGSVIKSVCPKLRLTDIGELSDNSRARAIDNAQCLIDNVDTGLACLVHGARNGEACERHGSD